MKNQKQKKRVSRYFESLPAEMIDQTEGFWSEDRPCCVGAHLANLLLVNRQIHFAEGANAWANLIGGNRAQAVLILRCLRCSARPLSPCGFMENSSCRGISPGRKD